MLWFVWPILLGVVLGLELYALLTHERTLPTLSKTLWRAFGFHDREFDRAEVTTRIALTIILSIIFIWLIYHLAWGPCEFGIYPFTGESCLP